jgi:hypothetical protein
LVLLEIEKKTPKRSEKKTVVPLRFTRAAGLREVGRHASLRLPLLLVPFASNELTVCPQQPSGLDFSARRR